MASSYQTPHAWMCGMCKEICSHINPWSVCCNCNFNWTACCNFCKCCDCDCCPDLCPREADQVAPEEVTAEDYADEDIPVRESQVRERSRVKEVKSSLVAFLAGMLLISLYAYVVLFWNSYNIWFCIASVVSMGFFLCIGMAFSVRIRITVLLMLPHLFSGNTRAILLVIILSLAMQGPAANTLENFQLATDSVSCGVEVVMNQTREMMSKVKEPLLNALKFLREMAGKVKTVAGKAKNFFHNIWGHMKRIGRTLNHLWSFISSIGDICNDELLNPHKKCLKAFQKGKADCLDHGFGFLCNIVDGFTWLCELTKIVTVICVIPSYVGHFIDRNVKAPVLNVIKDIKEKFDYNITINHDFGGTVNSSKGVFTIIADIAEELKGDLDPYREIIHVFTYSVFFVAIFTYVKALRYLQNYTTDDHHDNVYITRQFVALDARRAKLGLTTLLPLRRNEAYDLIRPKALQLTRKENKGHSFEIINLFRSLLIVSVIILGDYIVFWIMASISSILNGDITVKAPYILRMNVTGTGFLNDILHQLADAFDAIGRKNVTIIAKQCIPQPSEPNYYIYVTIGVLYIFTFFASYFGIYIHRLKRIICAYYYPQREQERICFLFNNLLTKRVNIKLSLINSIRMNIADLGHSNILKILAAHIPGFSCLATYFGATERYCMACAKMSTPDTSQDFMACVTDSCKGLYCPGCREILCNVCIICMGPLAYKEDPEEELDSSDDEQLNLWIEAMKNLKQKRAEKKKMKVTLKKRLKEIVKRRGLEAEVIKKYSTTRQLDSDEETSGFSEAESGSDSGVTDYDYQERSSDSECEDWPAVYEYQEPTDLIPQQLIHPEDSREESGDVKRGNGP